VPWVGAMAETPDRSIKAVPLRVAKKKKIKKIKGQRK